MNLFKNQTFMIILTFLIITPILALVEISTGIITISLFIPMMFLNAYIINPTFGTDLGLDSHISYSYLGIYGLVGLYLIIHLWFFFPKNYSIGNRFLIIFLYILSMFIIHSYAFFSFL